MLVYLAYNLVLLFFAPFFLLFLLYADRSHPRWKDSMAERLGRYGGKLPPPAKPRVWLHAVSVGEALGAAPLIRLILERNADCELVVSTTTRGGMEVLEKNAAGAIIPMYFPLDFPWTVRRAFNAVRPSILILMETEIWPNVLNEAHRRGVPALLLNGRVSDRMAAANPFVRMVYRRVFSHLSAAGMQSAGDLERLNRLGAPPSLAKVTGSMKFDGLVAPEDEARISKLRAQVNPGGAPLIVAGSTHPGEEEPLIDVFMELRRNRPGLRLALCPRHVERADEVAAMVKRKGLSLARRSRPASGAAADVLLVDTIGELRLLYRLSTASFVGGSLIPRGGHNVLEPAACGKAPFYGPHTRNFREAVRLLEEGGGGMPVADFDDLRDKMARHLDDERLRAEADARALAAVKANSGAAERAYAIFKTYFSRRSGAE